MEALSDREKEVLSRLAAGATPDEVAAAMGIAQRTLLNHLRNVLGKVEATIL